MLEITVTLTEGFDDETQMFVPTETKILKMEHSLVSVSKWESKWEKPFLDNSYEKTEEMTLDYIRFMILNDYEESHLNKLSKENVESITDYINSSQTATWFAEDQTKQKSTRSKVITSDLIYYWMVAQTIPFECQHWHLNRLITLIRITEAENRPKKKMSPKETINQHRALNQARRAKYGNKG